jgi:hypothetical protein
MNSDFPWFQIISNGNKPQQGDIYLNFIIYEGYINDEERYVTPIEGNSIVCYNLLLVFL